MLCQRWWSVILMGVVVLSLAAQAIAADDGDALACCRASPPGGRAEWLAADGPIEATACVAPHWAGTKAQGAVLAGSGFAGAHNRSAVMVSRC